MSKASFGASSTCDDVVADLDLSGRHLLVTGCNSGIGFETARALASKGAHVAVACRSRQVAEQTCDRIRALHPRAALSPLALDLGSFASVRSAAAALDVPVLHGLVCNAGLYAADFAQTADGIESTVGVCHFGHFLLFQQLRDKLLAANGARVVMVASESHRFPTKLDLGRFPSRQRGYQPLVSYGQAKLCNVLMANEITRRYGAHHLYANSLHPGSFIGTSIFRSSLAAKLLAAALAPFTKTVAQGAATSVYCAVSPALDGVGGRYFVDCAEKSTSGGARNTQVAAALWTLSEHRVAAGAAVHAQ